MTEQANSERVALEPCPACHADTELLKTVDNVGNPVWEPVCYVCEWRIGHFVTEAEATAAWNTRAERVANTSPAEGDAGDNAFLKWFDGLETRQGHCLSYERRAFLAGRATLAHNPDSERLAGLVAKLRMAIARHYERGISECARELESIIATPAKEKK